MGDRKQIMHVMYVGADKSAKFRVVQIAKFLVGRRLRHPSRQIGADPGCSYGTMVVAGHASWRCLTNSAATVGAVIKCT